MIFFSYINKSSSYKTLREKNITRTEDTIITFSDFSWDNCGDTGIRSTGANISIKKGGTIDHIGHLSIPVAMSSCEEEYVSAVTACMKANHVQKL